MGTDNFETESKLTKKPKSHVESDCDHKILSVPLEPVYQATRKRN